MINPKKARRIAFPIIILMFLGMIIYLFIGNPFDKIVNVPSVQSEITGMFLLYQNNCNFQETGGYKYIDIATQNNRIYTRENPQPSNYTKEIQISGSIDKLRLCVMADISDKSSSYSAYRKPNSYYGMIYLYFDQNNMGYINTAYYKSAGQWYDADSDSTHTLDSSFDGKFRSSDTPKRFILDLDSINVADNINGGYKTISPIALFESGAVLKVGGFMASLGRAYWASSISSYRLIYKGDGEITLK